MRFGRIFCAYVLLAMSALGEERTVPHASSNLRNLRNLQSQIRDLGLRAPFEG
jgi:hypothetical protein